MKHVLTCLAVAGMLVAGPALAQDTRTLSFGMQGTPGDPHYQGVMEAAKVLEEESNGRLKLEVFPNSQLGTFTEMMEQVTLGDLDFTLNPFGGMDPWVSRAVIASTAYVVKDFDHLQKILASDWGQGVLEEMRTENGWRTVDSWYFGTRETTSNKPITKLEDFKRHEAARAKFRASASMGKSHGCQPDPCCLCRGLSGPANQSG